MKYYHHVMAYCRDHPRQVVALLPDQATMDLIQSKRRSYTQGAELNCAGLVHQLRDAMKFQSVDDRTLMQLYPEAALKRGAVYLPFPKVYVEIPIGISDGQDFDTMIGNNTLCVYLYGVHREAGSAIMAVYFLADDTAPIVVPLRACSFIFWDRETDTTDIQQYYTVPEHLPNREALAEALGRSMDIYAFQVIRFLRLLDAPATTVEVFRPNVRQQEKARRQGRKLITYKTVKIDVNKVRVVNTAPHAKGTHDSPCLHIRRGTTRHYQSGKTRRVEATLVGDGSKGITLAEYVMAVKAGRLPATQQTWDYINEQDGDMGDQPPQYQADTAGPASERNPRPVDCSPDGKHRQDLQQSERRHSLRPER